jgi:hypothetical protein
MSDLKLESLRIQNFRTFQDLTIDRLGRVNLIVGKNNVGKTSLLEALSVWAHDGQFAVIWKLLSDHDETHGRRGANSSLKSTSGKAVVEAVSRLFHDGQDETTQFASIGPSDTEWGTLAIQILQGEEFSSAPVERPVNPKQGPVLRSTRDSEVVGDYPLTEGWESLTKITTSDVVEEDVSHIRSGGLSRENRLLYWDEIIQGIAEDRVYEALRIVEDRIMDVRFVGNGEEGRIPIVRLSSLSSRVPLRSLGEGVRRSFDLALSIERSADGIMLVDEFENGLHYSIQPELWRMIFETAQELDVQVFATTHSYDCVQAFQQVAEDYSEEGMLIQLRRKRNDPENIAAVTVDEDELQDALQFQVDPR